LVEPCSRGGNNAGEDFNPGGRYRGLGGLRLPWSRARGQWRARATFAPDSAIKIALARVPGGTISGGELEEEDGRLIYSFEIKIAGKSGEEEVHVDARTGEVVKQEHEG
jgi:uncharacterized membrane protein YkoI